MSRSQHDIKRQLQISAVIDLRDMELTTLLPVFVLFGLALGFPAEETQPVLSPNGTSTKLFHPPSCAQSEDRRSGVQTIHPQPHFGQPFEVFCEQEYEGGGWITIHRRFDGSVQFFRGWNDYENGFGHLDGEHWLGLSRIHELTYSNQFELRIDVVADDGKSGYAHGTAFLVAGQEDNYRIMSLGTSTGTVSMVNMTNHMFSTFDNDNDRDYANCVVDIGSAWWYAVCPRLYNFIPHSDLNAPYNPGYAGDSMRWDSLSNKGLRSARMLIREKQSSEQ